MADLSTRVVAGILRNLDRNGNYRSPGMQADMYKTASLMDRMINGDLERKYWVCDLPTGTGKTTLITSYCGYLAERLKDDGALICVPTLEEIRELTKRLVDTYGVQKSNIFIYTSDAEINALGCGEALGQQAQICITTQQMIDSRIINVLSFNALDIFKFKGRPRALRLWDEAILPWKEFALTVDDIAALPKLFRNYYPEMANRLHDISSDVRKCERGTYEFPDLLREHNFKHEDFKKDVLARFQNSEDARTVIVTLIGLCGNKVRISRDQHQNTVVSWKNHIPEDFLPVLIFDASGRARAMYDHYAACTKKLEIFTSATKRYDNVTFHHMNIAGSKTAWRKNAERLLGIVTDCVDAEPGRGCLVVHHKKEKTQTHYGAVPDVEGELSRSLRNRNVEFRTWGMHKHTNEYEELDKIVLAGLLYLPDRAIEVRTRGSNQLEADDEVEPEQLREVELGELRNDILQAVGRVCIRRSVKGDDDEAQSPAADVYIIASNNAGCRISDLLRDLFPGCTVKQLKVPGARRLQWEMALDVLEAMHGDAEESWIAHATVMEAIGMDNVKNFNQRVRRNAEFRKELAEARWEDKDGCFHSLPF